MVEPTRRRQVLAGAAALGTGTIGAGCLRLNGGRDDAGKERMRVALPRSNPPFAYRDRCCTWEANPLDGFDVALFDRLAQRLQRKPRYVDAGNDAIQRLRTEAVQVFAPGQPLPERLPDGTVAVGPTLQGYVCPLVRAPVRAPEDLTNRTVLAPPVPGIKRAVERLRARASDIELSHVPDVATARERFAAGDGAAILADQVTAAATARELDNVSILAGDGPNVGIKTPYLTLADVRFGYLFRTDGDLAGRVSESLEAVRGSDVYMSLRGRFFRPDGIPRQNPG